MFAESRRAHPQPFVWPDDIGSNLWTSRCWWCALPRRMAICSAGSFTSGSTCGQTSPPVRPSSTL